MASHLTVRVYGQPGTLYSRCGGVFGVSAFVDRCMDKWMADDVLNANQAVAQWHLQAQRCGFKFLVVQIVCNLTGGPQQYTGRPLDVAHKHLNISEEEWWKFLEIFNEVCAEFGLPADSVDDLNALMISMEEDCVVYPGQRVPPNPGPARPSGNTMYSRVGGVYPLALFADRLVDALLEDRRFRIPRDDQKRNEASLKYLFTELACNLCGGPEVVTCKEMDETKLLLPKGAWQIFMKTAEVAADHLPAASRPQLMSCLQRNKHLIVDPNSDDAPVAEGAGVLVAAKVKDLAAAAAGKMLSKETIAARHAAPGAHVAARRRVLGDPRTLYGRGGGVFGLAKVADRMMDTWMSDPALNSNEMVARWHESRQKYGFKFLVTQIMGYLTGGPQRYTGRSMAVAHKHLGITMPQWSSFIRGAQQSLASLHVPADLGRELMAIIENFRDDCVLMINERPSEDPGPSRPDPSTSGTLYYKLGGAYPIAHFADTLVELVLPGDRGVVVYHCSVDDPSGTRHPPGLKYMVTELVCNFTGGPEVVTSKAYDDAKLGVMPEHWPAFLTLVAEAAAIWPSPHVRNSLMMAIGNMKSEFCVGLVDEEVDESPAAAALKKVTAAGFEVIDASRALEHENGDADAALQLLLSGWAPDTEAEVAADMTVDDGPRCPFMTGGGTAPDSSGSLTADDRLRTAAVTMASNGMPPATIAQMLSLDEATVAAMLAPSASSNGSGGVAGRVLGNNLQMKLDELLVEDADLVCPISLTLFTKPVLASDGFLYDKSSLDGLFRSSGGPAVSPMTREVLRPSYTLSRMVATRAMEYRSQRGEQLLEFAREAAATAPNLAITALERVTEYVQVEKESLGDLARKAAAVWIQLNRPVPQVLR